MTSGSYPFFLCFDIIISFKDPHISLVLEVIWDDSTTNLKGVNSFRWMDEGYTHVIFFVFRQLWVVDRTIFLGTHFLSFDPIVGHMIYHEHKL